MEREMQILSTADQALMSLCKPITDAQCTLVDADAPKRLMIMRLDMGNPLLHGTAQSIAGSHCAGNARKRARAGTQ